MSSQAPERGTADRVSPVTKAARHTRIAAILAQSDPPVRSQEELADRLALVGVRVTQATLSRDLEELGAVRLRGPAGPLVYALPSEQRAVAAAGGDASGPHAAGQGTASAITSAPVRSAIHPIATDVSRPPE